MDLIQIKDDNFWNKIHEKHGAKGGVYKIIAFKDGQKLSIGRFLGQDKGGVLYIGKATSFINRAIELKKSISPDYNGSGHTCSRRYKGIANIALKFPFEILYMELTEGDRPEELEKKYLKSYEQIFGEVPPLNAVPERFFSQQ